MQNNSLGDIIRSLRKKARVQGCRRLIHDKDGCILIQGLRDRQLLGLAAGDQDSLLVILPVQTGIRTGVHFPDPLLHPHVRLSSCCFCDRILVLRDGVLLEEGSHEQLLKLGGEYRKLWEAQAGDYQAV